VRTENWVVTFDHGEVISLSSSEAGRAALHEGDTHTLGIELAQTVFTDNKKVNTDAAAALGATVHHNTGVAGLDAFLLSLAT